MKYNIIILLTVIFLSSVGCGDTPVFTEMSTNRLKVVMKGTLESEGASNFPAMPAVNDPLIQDDSVDDVTAGSADVLPENFMFDIAELRLDKHKFSNYRKIIEASLTDADDPFFDGTGIILKNDDPGEGNYDTVKVYIRKMVFDNAMIYQSTGNSLTYEEPAEVIFHENDVNGFDFNQLQVNSYWDSLRLEGDETLRNFPLRVPIIGGLDYNKDNEETVLEIRLVIKNFVKKYEYDYYDEGVFKVCHYFALSDWLRDVRAGENDIGQNIHAVARAYVPGKIGKITVTTGVANQYVIAIPSSEAITDYGLTVSADSNSDTLFDGEDIRFDNACDLPQAPSYPGEYIEAVLDYYLKYENYKVKWNAKVPGSCPDLTAYETAWDTYEGTVENFKIAPYVLFAASAGSYTFNDVAPGSYTVWRITYNPATLTNYGQLFRAGSFVQIGSTITVTAGSTISVP